MPHHIAVVDDGGLKRPSWAMCEAVRAVSIQRFIQRFGRLVGSAADETLDQVAEQLMLWLAPGPTGHRAPVRGPPPQ